jgi:hypothetical protein
VQKAVVGADGSRLLTLVNNGARDKFVRRSSGPCSGYEKGRPLGPGNRRLTQPELGRSILSQENRAAARRIASVGEMRIVYQIELDDSKGARTRAFMLEADSWPFPNLPSRGDAVAIDYSGGGLRVEQTGDAGFVIEPGPARRLNARMVDRVTYLPAAEYAIIHLVGDALTHDPQSQIDALLEAGFREVGS